MFTSIIPRCIGVFSTPYNPSIRIYEEYGRPKLLVGGSPQSGRYIEKLWKSVFDAFGISGEDPIGSVLVLGVGGGTVISMISGKYPSADIVGVDIDPGIIRIGKEYFHLDTIKHLQMICRDAGTYVKNSTLNRKFDLIIIDIFSGRHIPSFVGEKQFLMNLSRASAKNGRIIINFLQELEYAQKSETLYRLLNQLFPSARDYRIKNNRFFLVSPNDFTAKTG